MAETAFTPGPWRAVPWSKHECQIISDNAGKKVNVAGYSLPADARLIAAAPELFEALAGMVDGDSTTDIDERYENARAALAKAIGAA